MCCRTTVSKRETNKITQGNRWENGAEKFKLIRIQSMILIVSIVWLFQNPWLLWYEFKQYAYATEHSFSQSIFLNLTVRWRYIVFKFEFLRQCKFIFSHCKLHVWTWTRKVNCIMTPYKFHYNLITKYSEQITSFIALLIHLLYIQLRIDNS